MPMKKYNPDVIIKRHTAAGLFLIILITIFAVEFFTNAIANLFHLPTFPESLLDALMTVLVS